MALIDRVRSGINFTTTARDTDLQELIDAAIEDLRKQGVDASEETESARIVQAVILFCRAYGRAEDPNADRYMEMYTGLKAALSLQEGDPSVV